MKRLCLFLLCLLLCLLVGGCIENPNNINSLDFPEDKALAADDIYAFSVKSDEKEFEPPIDDEKICEDTVSYYISSSVPDTTLDTETKSLQTDAVWVTDSGKKYHLAPDCSNMKSAKEISLADAKATGYDACKKCYK